MRNLVPVEINWFKVDERKQAVILLFCTENRYIKQNHLKNVSISHVIVCLFGSSLSVCIVSWTKTGGRNQCFVFLSCFYRESAVNLVRSGSYTRQLWRDEAKGNETPQTIAPSTYVSTYLKRYQAQRGWEMFLSL